MRSLAMAQRPESLPELVDKFRDFVERILRSGFSKVIIAIDELDKIRSAAEAEQFLNEIKSVFNISNCFYLVSVSENAISSFERRGLAIRDAFDSAFDDIHFIAPLDLEGSRRLLGRRIINLPSSFLALCHILSGGLPRDLIRVARAMIALAGERPSAPDISEVALDLASQDAMAKLRASAIATRDFMPDVQATQVLVRIAELQGEIPGTPDFGRAVTELADLAKPPSQARPRGQPPPVDPDAEKIGSIANELAAYLEFLNLVLRVVATMKSSTAGKDDETQIVQAIAGARQSLEGNPEVARAHFKAIEFDPGLRSMAAPPAPAEPWRSAALGTVTATVPFPYCAAAVRTGSPSSKRIARKSSV